jgi:hypothetical protein
MDYENAKLLAKAGQKTKGLTETAGSPNYLMIDMRPRLFFY